MPEGPVVFCWGVTGLVRGGGRADFESGDYFAGHGGVEGVELLGAV